MKYLICFLLISTPMFACRHCKEELEKYMEDTKKSIRIMEYEDDPLITNPNYFYFQGGHDALALAKSIVVKNHRKHHKK